jgi:hypothetical protein
MHVKLEVMQRDVVHRTDKYRPVCLDFGAGLRSGQSLLADPFLCDTECR